MFLFDRRDLLTDAQIEITHRCNWNCGFCYLGREKKKEMETEDVFRLLDELYKMGCLRVNFTGGEPLIHRDALKILHYAKSKGFICTLNTNGSLINDSNVVELAETISDFYISLLSFDAEKHDCIVGNKNGFANTTNALRLLKELGANVVVNTIICKQNVENITEMKRFVEDELKCTWNPDTRIEPVQIGNVDKNREYQLSEDLLKSVLDKISVYGKADENGEDGFFTGLCVAARSACFIDVFGDVYPCLQFKGGYYKPENVYKKELKTIWESNPFFNEIRKLEREDFSKCVACGHYKKCYKCIANNYNDCRNLTIPCTERCSIEMLYAIYNTKTKGGD
ncbi:MAG: radical SAM protein [Lachnospiraceae bacterium]|nr:radical SAM protein [Lachnospiraceae bacterium]